MGFSAPHFVGRNAGYPVWRSGMTKPLGTHLTSLLPTVARTEATTSNVSGEGRSFCIPFNTCDNLSQSVTQNLFKHQSTYWNTQYSLLLLLVSKKPHHFSAFVSFNWVSFLDFL